MLKLPSKLNLFLLLALASLVLVQVVGFYGEREADDALRWRKHTQQALLAISQINERKDHTEPLVREYVLTGSEALASRSEKNFAEIHQRLAHARQLMGGDTNQVRRLTRLDVTLKELTGRWATTLTTRRAEGPAAASQLVADGTGRRLTDEAEFLLDKMAAEQNRLLEERSARAERFSMVSSVAMKAGGMLTILFGFLVWRTLLKQQMEEAIRASEALNRAVLNSVMANISVVDKHGTIIAVNEGWERFARESGADPKSSIVGVGANYLEVCERASAGNGNEAQEILNGIKDVLAHSRVTFKHEYACHSPTEQRWFSMQVSHLDRAEGGAVIAQINTTERKRAEDTLRTAHEELGRANAELDRASRHKDEFLANMSHELRTPLNAILGMSELLTEQLFGPLTPRQAKSVSTISSSGQHLLALINDILDLSKIEAGKLELHPEPLPVDEFCQSCLAFVRTQAMQKQINVVLEQVGGVAKFVADPKRFKQILVNLLTNAVKFTPQGGRIGLSVTAPEGEGMVRFTVWDSGIGIASADQTKLFRAFTQVDSGLNRSQEGTGLGLALVARLVELHGGSVALESEPDKGSRFIVTLPLGSLGAPVVASDAGSRDMSDGTPVEVRVIRRALVIEDDPTAGEQVMRYLAELDVTSVMQARGDGSVDTALRERPDVILLDLELPGESGWVVLAKLKEHPHTREIPVAVVSVVDEPEKSRALGASAHFTKPITREQLAAFLRRPLSPKAEPAPRFAPTAPATGTTILLAEDNEANIETLGSYLTAKGYAMHFALNGLIAVQLARELRPALILMDIQMPMMDGLTATRELRADAAFKEVPIIALTALAMSGDRERCLAAGATDYMSKPVELKELAALMEKLLGKRDA